MSTADLRSTESKRAELIEKVLNKYAYRTHLSFTSRILMYPF